MHLWLRCQFLIFAPPVLPTVHQSGFLNWPIFFHIYFIRSGEKPWQVNFCYIFHESLWLFHKVLWNFHKFYQKEKRKIENWLFLFPLLIKEMGHFKNPLWCTVDKTLGAKFKSEEQAINWQALGTQEILFWAFSCTGARDMTPQNFSSCCLNTLYVRHM